MNRRRQTCHYVNFRMKNGLQNCLANRRRPTHAILSAQFEFAVKQKPMPVTKINNNYSNSLVYAYVKFFQPLVPVVNFLAYYREKKLI